MKRQKVETELRGAKVALRAAQTRHRKAIENMDVVIPVAEPAARACVGTTRSRLKRSLLSLAYTRAA